MMRRVLLSSLLLLLPAVALAQPLRPGSGCGVLSLASWPGEKASVVLYREPGVARLAEVPVAALPSLAGGTEPLLSASARKGEWVRVVYDDAGREAWLEQPRSWRYLPWQDYLPGRLVQVLAGLKKGSYALRSAAGETSGETGALGRDTMVRVLRLEGDWALLETPAGWFRWRDGDGRLNISLAR